MAIKNMVRVPPVPQDDLEGLAGWLESMALEGLYFKGIFYSRHFFTSYLFKEGPPAQVRYRIDPTPGTLYNEPPAGLVDLYEETGWTYMGSTGRYRHFFMTKDADLPEPFDQPETLGQAIEPQIKARKQGLLFAFGLLLLDGLLVFHILRSALVLHRPVYFQIMLILLLVLALTLSVRHLRILAKQKREFQQGRAFTPNTPTQRPLRFWLVILFAILCTIVDLWQLLR